MNPVLLARHVQDSLRELVHTTLNSTSPAFEGMVDRFIAEPGNFLKGPWISVDMPFRQIDGAADGTWEQPFPEVPLRFAPYQHQTDAFARLSGEATHVHFGGIDLPEDLNVIHEIVGSYAVENGLGVDEDLLTEDFYHRLAIASAMRWGTLIKMTIASIAKARVSGSSTLTRDHYVDFWAEKANVNALATPFTHDGYETMFRPDKPFQAFIS